VSREHLHKAAARSALPDARGWFEQALGVFAALPESPSTLEQGFEIRLELRPTLILLGEVRRVLERLREAEALAEQLNDDRRRGQVCAVLTNAHSHLGELDDFGRHPGLSRASSVLAEQSTRRAEPIPTFSRLLDVLA
jgi:hypothetical protein